MPPEGDDPVYEASQFGVYTASSPTFEFDSMWQCHVEGEFDRFGCGHGFGQVDQGFRAGEPFTFRVPEFEDQEKGFPDLALYLSLGCLLVNSRVFDIIQKVEPIPPDRHLLAQGRRRGKPCPTLHHLIDPPVIPDMIDFNASGALWVLLPNGKVLAFLEEGQTIFRPGQAFHLARSAHSDLLEHEMFISEDLLFTLYAEGAMNSPEYQASLNPKRIQLGHIYQPKKLI